MMSNTSSHSQEHDLELTTLIDYTHGRDLIKDSSDNGEPTARDQFMITSLTYECTASSSLTTNISGLWQELDLDVMNTVDHPHGDDLNDYSGMVKHSLTQQGDDNRMTMMDFDLGVENGFIARGDAPQADSPTKANPGPGPDTWTNSVTELSSKLAIHRKAMQLYIAEVDAADQLCPLDETLRLALLLLRSVHQFTNEMPGLNAHDVQEDQANVLLLLSCYTRLVGILCESLAHLQAKIPFACPSSLPSVRIGTFSLDEDQSLWASTMVSVAENLVSEIGRKFSNQNHDPTVARILESQQTMFSRQVLTYREVLVDQNR